MAINPLQLPGPFVAPQVDWSPIQQIGESIGRYRQDQRETEAFGTALDATARGASPAAPGPAGAPAAAPGAVPNLQGSLPRGIRNNNPGNIEDGSFAKALPGYKGSDGRFAIFESPEHGLQAMDTLLTSYGRRGLKTVNDVISRWAPSSDGNNVSAYAQFVANGGDPNAPIDLANPEVRRTVATRMAQFENGQPVQGGAGPAPAPTPPDASARMGRGGLTPQAAARIKALYDAGGKGRDAAWGLLMKLTGPKDPIKLSENEALVDPDTYQTIARGPGKRTAVRPGGTLVDENNRPVYTAPNAPTKGETIQDQAAARRTLAIELGMNPTDPQTKVFIATGKHPGEDRISASAQKAIFEAEDENAKLDDTIKAFERVRDLNGKIYTGFGAGGRAWLGTQFKDGLVPDAIADPETAQATEEWLSLMKPEAIKNMSATLKGATTDREMATFMKQIADPTTTPKTREALINRLFSLATRQREINQTRMDQLRGGGYFKPGGGQSNVTGSIPDGAARDLKANPTRERRMQFDEIFGKGEAAKILGAGPR